MGSRREPPAAHTILDRGERESAAVREDQLFTGLRGQEKSFEGGGR